MLRRRALVPCWMAVCLAVAGLGCATSEGARAESPREGPLGPVVRAVELEGVTRLSAEEVRGRLVMQPPKGWFSRDVVHFDPFIWDEDLRRIERFYESRGYYGARVVGSDVEQLPDGVRLRARVEEGLPVQVLDVRVEWDGDVPADVRAEVMQAIPYRAGEPFRETPWTDLRETLVRILMERGFAGAQVQGEVRVHPPTREAVVHVVVKPGEPYTFGSIVVTGSEQTQVPLERISGEVRHEIPEGERFSLSALREIQARVFRMGLFTIVRVAAGTPEPEHLTVPVLVDVRERPLRTLRAGGGVQIDQSRNEARALGEFVHRDFLGGFRTFRARVTAGYAALPDVWNVVRNNLETGPQHGPVALARMELEQPRLLSPDVTGFALVEGERGLEQAYTFLGARGRFGANWTALERLTIRPSYNVEVYRLGGRALSTGAEPQTVYGCPNPCVLSYLEQRAVYDARDDSVQPSRGYFLAASLQEGARLLGGSTNYLRIEPEARVYFPLDGEAGRLILGARVLLGTLLTPEGEPAPIIARFFSGGASTMRGFNHRRLSPMLVVPVGEGLGTPVQVGGQGRAEGSVELRYLMTQNFGVAAFADTGTVTIEPLAPAALSQLQYAVGGGVRYRSPLGPLRLDVAYRLPWGPALPMMQLPGQDLEVPEGRGCFGLGGYKAGSGGAEGPCSVFLSVGETF